MISLTSGLVSDKDHWDRLGIEFLPFVVVDPGPASEDAEVGNVRDATSEGLIWRSPFKKFSSTSVDHVNGDGKCFDPEAVLSSQNDEGVLVLLTRLSGSFAQQDHFAGECLVQTFRG